MTDIFPAICALYAPEYANTHEKPFELVGFSDKGAEKFVECRVIVHNSTLFVGIDTPRGPKTIFSDTYAPENVFQASPYTRVLTNQGYLVVIGVSKGCGCGSRLRSWNPYGQIARSSRDSTP